MSHEAMGHEAWMRLAVEQARQGMALGQTPFGAVIVRGDELIAGGHNEVWASTDPSAHAEVVAIRRAGAALNAIDFTGCRMYTTCEPCPMCAAAIHWARLDEVVFGAGIDDAAGAGFNELTVPIDALYRQGGSRVRVVGGVLTDECRALFATWRARADRRAY